MEEHLAQVALQETHQAARQEAPLVMVPNQTLMTPSLVCIRMWAESRLKEMNRTV